MAQNIGYVSIKVSPILREYYMCINGGSDIIVPDRRSPLWVLVKTHLGLCPADYVPQPACGTDDTLRIVLLHSKASKGFSVNAGKLLQINTLFRNYVGETGQRAISQYLMRRLKDTFRTYVTGALSNNPDLSIKDAIYEFTNDYNLTMDHVTYEMLRKDWYRFRERRKSETGVPVENRDI